MQTVFYPSLGELCTKYLVKRTPDLSLQEQMQFVSKFAEEQRQLFEQFLLFDTIAIRIRGDNLPLPMLLQIFGERGLEELIEQGAIRFIQWKSGIFHMVTDIPGVNALAFGDMKSATYDDPEKSIDFGFDMLKNPLPKNTRRRLRAKIAPLYENAEGDLAKRAVEFTNSAYTSGKLSKLGLPPVDPLTNMPRAKRERMNACASEVTDYSYVMDKGMTSLTNYTFFSLLSDSAEKLKKRADMVGGFNELSKVEAFPDLKALFPQLKNPLQQLPALRGKASSIKFRKWLAETTRGDADLSAAYVAAIADLKGPFATPKGKFVKAIAMTGIGAGVGAGVAALTSMAVGAVAAAAAAPVIEPALELGMDLLDAFVLEGLTKGWSPRIFFDDLKELERRDLRQDAGSS